MFSDGHYLLAEKGIAISDVQKQALNLVWDSQIPKWNYSIVPTS